MTVISQPRSSVASPAVLLARSRVAFAATAICDIYLHMIRLAADGAIVGEANQKDALQRDHIWAFRELAAAWEAGASHNDNCRTVDVALEGYVDRLVADPALRPKMLAWLNDALGGLCQRLDPRLTALFHALDGLQAAAAVDGALVDGKPSNKLAEAAGAVEPALRAAVDAGVSLVEVQAVVNGWQAASGCPVSVEIDVEAQV